MNTTNQKFYDLLGRNNKKEEVINKINLCKQYFENINIDLMYGFNNQTIEDLDKENEKIYTGLVIGIVAFFTR